jgi:hypothetical protein
MNVASGARTFLLYISAQISHPPSMHKFLSRNPVAADKQSAMREQLEPKADKVDENFDEVSPQGSGSFDHDLLLGVRESAD